MINRRLLIFWSILSTIVFIVFTLIGYMLDSSIARFIESLFRSPLIHIRYDGLLFKITLFILIFIKNVTTATLNVAFGPLLGVFPVMSILINGIIIGSVVREVYLSKGLTYVILGLAPHGVIELPTFIYSSALGLYLAQEAFRLGLTNQDFIITYRYAIKLIIKVIAPLLLIAAFIEAFITSALLGI